jgi:Putative zinc-finger
MVMAAAYAAVVPLLEVPSGILIVASLRASRGLALAEVAVTAQEEAIDLTERAGELAFKQLVELAADYLEDALSPQLRSRFEAHLAGCDRCTTYLSQTQQVIAELRRLSESGQRTRSK